MSLQVPQFNSPQERLEAVARMEAWFDKWEDADIPEPPDDFQIALGPEFDR